MPMGDTQFLGGKILDKNKSQMTPALFFRVSRFQADPLHIIQATFLFSWTPRLGSAPRFPAPPDFRRHKRRRVPHSHLSKPEESASSIKQSPT